MSISTKAYGRSLVRLRCVETLAQQFEELQKLRDLVQKAEANAKRRTVPASQNKSRPERPPHRGRVH
jgi:hypothetical protein